MNTKCVDAMATLEEWVGEPRGGLPEDFFRFVSRFTPIINVDLLIQDAERGTLLTWRDDEIYGAGWHVPGGIIRYKETLEERLHATALRELGVDVEFDSDPIAVEPLIAEGRRERGHFISLVYRCRLMGAPRGHLEYRGGVPVRDQWAWHRSCPVDLIADQQHYRKFF